MQDGEGLTSEQVQTEQMSIEAVGPVRNTVAVEVVAVNEDTMDTTLDTDQQLVPPGGSVSQANVSADQPYSPSINDSGREEAGSSVQTVPVAAMDDAVSARAILSHAQ